MYWNCDLLSLHLHIAIVQTRWLLVLSTNNNSFHHLNTANNNYTVENNVLNAIKTMSSFESPAISQITFYFDFCDAVCKTLSLSGHLSALFCDVLVNIQFV